MRKNLFNLLLFCSLGMGHAFAQQIDTLAFQDFEVVPTTSHPVWNFTGPVVYNSGNSAANAAPPNSPLGINSSRAWETTSNSGGLILNFTNTTIPAGYDSVRVRFRLAAMDLAAGSGGPDDLDYVLVAVSTDGGTTVYNRMRIRGATTNNSVWPYSATGYAKVAHLPATEAVFQPTTSGLQTTFGYSTCEIVFPGTVSQVQLRITGRSSSSSDTWLVDNLVLVGERCFVPSVVNASICNGQSYQLPNGSFVTTAGTYSDTVIVAGGCDSVQTINLTVLSSSTSNVSASICDGDSYLRPGGGLATTTGTYTDVLTGANGCDSTIVTTLTVNPNLAVTNSVDICDGDSYTLPGGTVVNTTGTYVDSLSSSSGCDSVITTNLNVAAPIDTTVLTNSNGLLANAFATSYQWYNCVTGQPVPGETNQNYTPFVSGTWSVQITVNNCTVMSECVTLMVAAAEPMNATLTASPNPTRDAFVLSGWNSLEAPAIRVFDIAGREVPASVTGQGSSLRISLQSAPAGVYLVEATGIGRLRVVKRD